jgi:hypothetical protein
MRPGKILPLLLLPALLGACASKPPEPLKFTVNGFSMSIPPKDGWGVLQQTPERVALGKPGDFTAETLTIQMLAVKLSGQSQDALLREVRDTERRALDPTRFRILRQDIKPYMAGTLACVISLFEIEDRAAAGPTGPVASLIVESMTLTCPDPGRPTQGVSLSYSHQSYPEDKGRQFAEKGMPILNSLVLGEPR